MPLPPDSRQCLTCGTMLAGRIDKKFCDDYCRSMYNNKTYNSNRGATLIRKVNGILRKNRRILEELLPADEQKINVKKSKLTGRGFNFNFYTSAFAHKRGVVYYFCYEYGYLSMEGDQFMIIRRDEVVR